MKRNEEYFNKRCDRGKCSVVMGLFDSAFPIKKYKDLIKARPYFGQYLGEVSGELVSLRSHTSTWLNSPASRRVALWEMFT